MNKTFSNPSQDNILKPYACDVCDYRAETKTQVQNHKSHEHPLYCCICPNKLFVSKTQCNKHFKLVHIQNKTKAQ